MFPQVICCDDAMTIEEKVENEEEKIEDRLPVSNPNTV